MLLLRKTSFCSFGFSSIFPIISKGENEKEMYMWELFVSLVRRRVFTVTYLLCEDFEVAWRWNFAVSTYLVIKKLRYAWAFCIRFSGTASDLYHFDFLLCLKSYTYNISDIWHRLFNYRHHFLYYLLNSLFLTSFMSCVTSNYRVSLY